MTGVLALRRLGALDLDLAAALHAESLEPLGERGWTRQDVAELLASPGVAGLVLQESANDVGFALWRVVADQAELLTIAIGPRSRRRGGGRRLLRAIIEDARALGARALFLEVGTDNPPARMLYERMGFRETGRRAGYYRRGAAAPVDAVTMALTLV